MKRVCRIHHAYMMKKGLSKLEKAVGCGKKRPTTDITWLFSQVSEADNNDDLMETPRSQHHPIFQVLRNGTETVSLLDQQTYRQWRSFMGQQRLSHPRRLRQRTIIIQPFTSPSLPGYTLNEVHTDVLEHVRRFCTAFFSGMTIELASSIDITTLPNLTSRVHTSTQRLQYLVGDILRHLEQLRPRHAQCVIGVTTIDLYPSPEWNFVLGHASLSSGCAVFGFGRYFSSQFSAAAPTVSQQLEQLWVLCRVVSHELCHTLGMKHCYYFHCAMNESISIEQASTQPLFLCPICLRKLKKILQFDIFKCYSELKEVIGDIIEILTRLMKENDQESDLSSTAQVFDDEQKIKSEANGWSGVKHESINSSFAQESPLSSTSQLMSFQQAHEWLDHAINTNNLTNIQS